MITGVELTDEAKSLKFKGIIRLENISDPNEPESDPNWILTRTLLLEKDKVMLEKAINELNTGKSDSGNGKGVYVLKGLMGSGKSHRLVFLYHLFNNVPQSNEFLEKYGLPEIEQKPRVAALNATAEISGYYLDEAILSKLGIDWTEARAPSKKELEELLGSGPLVIIIDELERWLNQFRDRLAIFNRNLVFLQNLLDVASEDGRKILVFMAIYGTQDEPLSTIRRIKPFFIDLGGSDDIKKIAMYRLIKRIDKNRATRIADELSRKYADAKVNVNVGKKDIENFFPFHPYVLDVLANRYASHNKYQNTRGLLPLLAIALLKSDNDILLLSDISFNKNDIVKEFKKIESEFTQIIIESDVNYINKLNLSNEEKEILINALSAVFLRSINSGPGGTVDEIVIDCLRPSFNFNAIKSLILKLRDLPHIHEEDSRLIARREINPANVVTLEAETNPDIIIEVPNEILDTLSKLIGKRGEEVYLYDTICNISNSKLLESPKLKLVFILDYYDDQDKLREELEKFLYGKRFQNTFVFIVSQEKIRDRIISITRRVIAARNLVKKGSGKRRKAYEKLHRDYKRILKDELKKIKWNVVVWIKSDDGVDMALLPLENLADDPLKHYPDYEQEIIRILEETDDERISFGELKGYFLNVRGKKPIRNIGELKRACQNLARQNRIHIIMGGRIVDELNRDDAIIVLGPPPRTHEDNTKGIASIPIKPISKLGKITATRKSLTKKATLQKEPLRIFTPQESQSVMPIRDRSVQEAKQFKIEGEIRSLLLKLESKITSITGKDISEIILKNITMEIDLQPENIPLQRLFQTLHISKIEEKLKRIVIFLEFENISAGNLINLIRDMQNIKARAKIIGEAC